VCQGCPVRDACPQYAFETRQTDGIWGGTTERQRRRLRRAWLAGRRLLAPDGDQAPSGISFAPEPELSVAGPPLGRPVARPPADAAPPVPGPFTTAPLDRRRR
jgi:hypothetical protein